MAQVIYLRSEFPSGRSNILMSDGKAHNSELFHFVLVLSDNGVLWVDVFWPYDEDIYTWAISEREFWETFREWRLRGLSLGDSGRVAEKLAHKCLSRKLSLLG
ncbi:hypothetical protein CEB3_c03150 [Peptococcaceae bacterium CEB3]|nr:hypothetical protein CEB3_c03150 [Peptococcaceae bacterium CEB3]